MLTTNDYHKRIKTILTQGQVMIGRVLTAVGSAEESGYKVAVTYEFMAPTGQFIQGHSAEIRNDLTAKTLPAAKTPVAVLYISANDFFLL